MFEGNKLTMKKMILILTSIMVVAMLFTACSSGPVEIAKPQPSEGATMFTAEGNCEAALNGNVLTISGTANLMDGTNGIISVINADGTMAEEFKFTKESSELSHDFEVADDWQDVVYGYITFDTQQAKSQPSEVTEVYGKKFENIQGPESNVIWDTKGVIVTFRSGEVKVR